MHTLKLDHASVNRLFMFAGSKMYEEIISSGLDVYSHNGIIIPKTHKASKQVVDLAHYVIQKWFAVKEKYL